MDLGVVYHIETAQQFWSELEDLAVIPPGASLALLDATLRNYVAFCANYHEKYLQAPAQLDYACTLILDTELFEFHSGRMSDVLVEDAQSTTDPHMQLILYKFLLRYGKQVPNFMRSAPKWLKLIPLLMDHILLDFDPELEDTRGMRGGWIEARLRILSVTLLYEVCRVRKFDVAELQIFDDNFLDHLFDLVELTRNMRDETLNYSVIKLIVALNEQFMVAAVPKDGHNTHHYHAAKDTKSDNRVLQVLIRRLGSSKTFGENTIFMLNRAEPTKDGRCMQLLVLKLLYLLFTTRKTQEFFYTNDLCVLVDVFLRELDDLDVDSDSLQHTFLRVLHPLLTQTPLKDVPYKRPQISRTLEALIRPSQFRETNVTTTRLVERCLSGPWATDLRKVDLDRLRIKDNVSPTHSSPAVAAAGAHATASSSSSVASNPSSPESPRSPRSLRSARSVQDLRRPPPRPGKKSGDGPRRGSGDSANSFASLASAPPPVPRLPGSASLDARRRVDEHKERRTSGGSLASMDLTVNAPPRISSLGVEPQLIVRPATSAGTTHSRTAPPPPVKRRKPPPVPAGRLTAFASTTTITAIASSVKIPSPLAVVHT